MSNGNILHDSRQDDFDPVGELDYDEDEPDVPIPAPVMDPQLPSSSSNARVESSNSLPGLADAENDRVLFYIGPALPPGFVLGAVDDGAPDDPGHNDNVRGSVGPSLPPGLGLSFVDEETVEPPPEPSSSRSIGPTLPPHLINQESNEFASDADAYAPALPPVNAPIEEEDDDNDYVIGPLPLSSGNSNVERDAEEYALRRLAYEQEKEAQANNSKREEWMLQLPKKLTNYGLGARAFSKGGGGEKDKSWTDAPGSKRSKPNEDDDTLSENIAAAAWKARDQEQEKLADKLNKSRQESLLDAHQKTRKQDTANSSAMSGVRKPFDREKDMEVRGLKNASADEIKQKCGNLGSRFGSSTQQKFL